MKKDIHPKYEKVTIECACGNKLETRSTVFPSIKVELCSACHPFFTGKQKFVDTAGRVDKFKARQEAAQKVKSKNAIPDGRQEKVKKADKTQDTVSNKEKLNELKKELTAEQRAKEAPGEIGQAETSDVEAAAEEELKEN